MVLKKNLGEIDSKTSIIEKAKEKKFDLKEDLKLTELEIKNLKKEHKRITNILLTHYHKLLRDGIDTRLIFINKKTGRDIMDYKGDK